MPRNKPDNASSYYPKANRRRIHISVQRFYDCDPEGNEVGSETRALSVSVPVVVRHHRERPGPEGLEVGRVSPGSLDLALNILVDLYPPGMDGEEPQRCRVNFVSATAYRLHESFCAKFLAPMEKDGGEIDGGQIRRWVESNPRSP